MPGSQLKGRTLRVNLGHGKLNTWKRRLRAFSGNTLLPITRATLLATQVARVQFPGPARPTFRVERVALFCNPASFYLIWSSGPHEIYKSRERFFSTAELIWSSGPHEIYKNRECNTFLLFISFGLLVLTKFNKAEIAFFSNA
jgi:hypothetical protein